MSNSVIEKIKPVHSEEYIDINSSFWIHYGYFKNEFSFERPSNSWSKWDEKDFVQPVNNLMVREGYDEGVELGCFEHVSICLQGNADYTLETPNGELIQNWTFGTHNVENGWGYLPKGKFVRTFHDDFVLCCVLQKSDRPQNLIYNFDVLTETRSLVREVEFAHVAYGSMTVDSVQYNQKQSLFNLNSNATLVINSNSIVIIGYKI